MIPLQLEQGTLIKRYKRFLADIKLSNGKEITIHCPNTGAMTGCAIPGSTVYFSTSDNPKRKYPNTWELCRSPDNHWITINTNRANELIYKAFEQGTISEFNDYQTAKREVKYGENSRADLMLTGEGLTDYYVEVKSVTLLQQGQGYFPDAVTTRGQKHLQELMAQVKLGNKACLLFCVQHSAINSVKAADHIDPEYARLLLEAKNSGVEVLAYKAQISPKELIITESIEVVF